ncbi:MAG: hypothetical protein LBB78_09690 [Spirochaetaceae bacterium]|nr:hypothetical protein [Spirochaetaceae bacterium]
MYEKAGFRPRFWKLFPQLTGFWEKRILKKFALFILNVLYYIIQLFEIEWENGGTPIKRGSYDPRFMSLFQNPVGFGKSVFLKNLPSLS